MYIYNDSSLFQLPYINVHTQLFLSHLQLVVLLGLTKDEGESLLSRLCNTRLCQFLGQYSMALYMLHDPVIKILVVHAQLLQVTIDESREHKDVRFTFSGTGIHPDALHCSYISVQYSCSTYNREANLFFGQQMGKELS